MKLQARSTFFKIAFGICLGIILFLVQSLPAQASGILKVTNQDGVMYVTTDQDLTAQATTPTTQPARARDVVNAPINPGRGFATDIGNLINFALRIAMVLAILFVFFHLVSAGIQWIMSGGDKAKTDAAKNKVIAAVVGLVIVAASYAILLIIIRFLGFSDLPSVLNSVGTINNPGDTTVIVTPVPSPSPNPSATPSLRSLID